MNVLKDIILKAGEKVVLNTLFGEETYCFNCNLPASLESIENFEYRNSCKLPDYYKDFLLFSDGATIFKSEFEDDGYKILGIEELEELTKEMNESGYELMDNCYCFMKCMFSEDVLLFDLNKETEYIIDGDVGYPSNRWKYIKTDLNGFFGRLCQSNGAMFWRW